MKTRWVTYIAAMGLCSLASVAGVGEYEIRRWTVDGGGVMRSEGGEFEMSGTVGQPDTSAGAVVMSGGEYEVTGGFWFRLSPGDCDDDGTVSAADHFAFLQCETGPEMPGVEGGCRCFDVNVSNTVDLADFAKIQASFTE